VAHFDLVTVLPWMATITAGVTGGAPPVGLPSAPRCGSSTGTTYTRIGYRPVRSGTIDESYPWLALLLATPCDFVIYHKDLAQT
jgi:hypothetical protein